jgi:hypothetical protein
VRTEELIAATRMSAFIGPGTSYTDWDDPRVTIELNDKLQSAFEDVVVKARAGYWLHEFVYTTIANDSDYRIPARSVVGGLEKVEIASGTSQPYTKLDEIPVSVSQNYRSPASSSIAGPSNPYVYCVNGDLVDVIPTPPAGYLLKLTYYIRPSRLVTSQSSTQFGALADRGRITAINTSTRVVTVNALPFDYSLTTPVAITSGTQTLDCVHPDGWHELSYVGATQTLSGTNITFTDSQDMTDIQVGDYVRVADQTDWPCLPDDFHRCLADTAAIKILLMMALDEKAAPLTENVGNDINRFKSLLLPRVKADPKSVPLMRRSRGVIYPWWRMS